MKVKDEINGQKGKIDAAGTKIKKKEYIRSNNWCTVGGEKINFRGGKIWS
jgi:hypothetical protein